MKSVGGQLVNGLGGCIMGLEDIFQLLPEGAPHSEINRGSAEESLAKGGHPGEGRVLSHVLKHKCNHLGIRVANIPVHFEVEGNAIKSKHGFGVVAIKGIRRAKTRLH